MRDPGRPSFPPTEESAAGSTSAVQGPAHETSVVQGPRPQFKAASAVQGSTSAVQTPLVQGYEEGIDKGRCTTGTRSTWEVTKFAAAHGRQGRLSRPEFTTWAYRLDVESGRCRPYEVGATRLPDDSNRVVRTSFDGFVYLLACRWLHTPFEPAPWTHEFAAAWCGIPARLAKDARRELVQMKALIHVGDWKRAKLWLPRGVSRD
jgi:hypothetical protein